MRLFKKQLFIFQFLTTISFLSCGQENYQTKEAYADAKVTEFAKDYPGVSITIIKDSTIVWSKQMWFSDLDSIEFVTDKTLFNIYSTSKFLTGLSFLKLAQQRGTDFLNKPITNLGSGLRESFKDITLFHLLTHTSGIRHYSSRKDWIRFAEMRCDSPKEAMGYFLNDKLKFQPGKKDLYTTFGMVVASHLLEQITGMTFTDAINDLVPISQPILIDSQYAIKATPYVRKTFSGYEVYKGLSAESKYGGGGLMAKSKQHAQIGA